MAVSSKSKQLGTWRISNYTPEFRETSGVGKRPVLTPDEVLRLPIDKALVIIRGKKILKVDKLDYSRHPEYEKLHSCKASAHIPEWRKAENEAKNNPQDGNTETAEPPARKTGGRKPKPTAAKKTNPAAAEKEKPVQTTPPADTAAPAGIIPTDKDSIMS